MRNMIRAVAVAAALSASVPAMAASVVNPNGTVTLVAGSPLSWTFDYNGFTDGNVAIPGLSAQITFNFLNRTNNTYNFSYTLRNTSAAPVTAARIVAFGFNTDPNFVSATTGANDMFNIVAKGNQPNNLPSLDFCLKDQSNQTNQCTSGQGGLALGAATSGTFALTFANSISPLNLSDFSVRYQGITAPGFPNESGSASGVPTAIPEPATWAMMIGGFGLIGGAVRRRRTMVAYA
jgi:hypothetical protein